MERLTFEGNFCDIALCESTNLCGVPCSQKEVWERLKEYEDTGITPEQIRAMQAMCRAFAKEE